MVCSTRNTLVDFINPAAVPLVVVFTKLDSLVNMLNTQALQTGQLLDGNALEERKREALEKFCLGPIRTAMGNDDVLSVAVSSK